jgi:Xaa-Pro aminopeptidase
MDIYFQRRQQLLQQLPPNSMVILPSADEMLRNADTQFSFRQNSNFYYLSGFNEPDSFLVLRNHNNHFEYNLFVRPNNPAKEVWTGKRAGLTGAQQQYHADNAYLVEDFSSKLREWLPSAEIIYYPFASKENFDRLLLAEVKSTITPVFYDVGSLLGEMRLIKSAAEIELMQQAANISAQAHIRAMQACKPDMYEYELAAEYIYVFAYDGCAAPAYSPIVAGGANACTLHYVDNQAQLRDGELVLVDAAGEYQNYAADITRTYPVNGKFTAEQRAIYEIVLRAQEAVIKALSPGVSCRLPQEISTRVITEGLVELGILTGNIDELLEQRAYLPYFMHGCSHWLGLDTHDAGNYKLLGKWRELAPGMVLTVEPGIYIRPETGADPRWHNIGVRIEDDVLITADGHHVLTSAVPSSIAEIEALMA